MLRLYLDDSGTDDEAPVVTMGGYLASVAGWERFEHYAAPILADFNISCLHAVDFHHGRGEFAGWTGVRKGQLVARLYTEAAVSKLSGTSFSAIKRVYDDRRSALRVNHQLSAYGFCFNAIINAYVGKPSFRPVFEEHGCSILIERGNKHDGDISRLFEELSRKYEEFPRLFPSLTFIDKRSCVAIQLADFLAYHDRRQMLAAHRSGDHANPPPDSPAMVTAKQLVAHNQIIATDFHL